MDFVRPTHRDGRLGSLSLLRQQLVPRASQCLPNAECGRHEHIDVARLDFLDGADVEVNEFGQPLLGNPFFRPLAAHVGTDFLQVSFNGPIVWHALLGRSLALTRTAQWGVI